MKLMSVEEYRKKMFTIDSCPSARQVIRWIRAGYVRGRKMGKLYFVNVDTDSKLTGNPLLDRVLLSGEDD